jgi:hypothetical protein
MEKISAFEVIQESIREGKSEPKNVDELLVQGKFLIKVNNKYTYSVYPDYSSLLDDKLSTTSRNKFRGKSVPATKLLILN